MERSTSEDVEHDLQRSGDELEERLGALDEHIDDARQEAQARAEDTDTGADDEDPADDGGEDPAEFDDPDAAEDDEDE